MANAISRRRHLISSVETAQTSPAVLSLSRFNVAVNPHRFSQALTNSSVFLLVVVVVVPAACAPVNRVESNLKLRANAVRS